MMMMMIKFVQFVLNNYSVRYILQLYKRENSAIPSMMCFRDNPLSVSALKYAKTVMLVLLRGSRNA